MELLGMLYHWFLYAPLSEVMGVFSFIGAVVCFIYMGD